MRYQKTISFTSALALATFASACSGGGDDATAAGGGSTNPSTSGGTGSGNSGGNATSGGASPTGGSGNGGSGNGSSGNGGSGNGGGINSNGGPAAGGSGASDGGSASGAGGSAAGGSHSGGGTAAGGSGGTGGNTNAGGGSGAGGGGAVGTCDVTVSKNEISSKMATVGVVEWSLSGGTPTAAKIVYSLQGAQSGTLNAGGEAPVDLKKANYHTLLLGLKQNKDYKFHIEATLGDGICKSEDFTLPKTGALSGAPTISVSASAKDKREPGFIITSSGLGGGGGGGGGGGASGVYVVDADGEVVWYSTGPGQPSRALMDYEGENMWMLALNVQNSGGEMRYVSMDGQTTQTNVTGLSKAHHDFTVLPGGKVAAMVWRSTGMDPESDLVIRSPDGSLATPFKIGSNLYSSSTFHCNAIHYIPKDDSFTISDRNPNLFVKVSSAGQVQWQLGGSCSNAPAGTASCSAQSWKVNHGHHWLDDGTFVLFNNGQSASSHIFEFKITATDSSMTATLVKDYTGTTSSTVLGDVQRLPKGNTLITYSTNGKIIEVDSAWSVVQTFSGSFGYASWRPTMYGPPVRL